MGTDFNMKRFGAIRLYRGDVSLLHRAFYRVIGVSPDHFLRFKYLRGFMNRYLDGRPPRRILDAGCGGGDYSFYLAANFPAARVLGIDVLEERINRHRKSAERAMLTNVEFEQQDIVYLNHAETFDFICCIDVLEHIVEQQQAMEKLRDALTPDGILFIHLPLKREKPVIFDKFLRDFHEWTEHKHVAQPHSRESFIGLAETSGFKVLAVENTFNHYLGELAVSITMLFYRNTLFNRLILCVLMPFMYLLVYLDYWIKDKNGNALAMMVRKKTK